MLILLTLSVILMSHCVPSMSHRYINITVSDITKLEKELKIE